MQRSTHGGSLNRSSASIAFCIVFYPEVESAVVRKQHAFSMTRFYRVCFGSQPIIDLATFSQCNILLYTQVVEIIIFPKSSG
jgi:hypothetical protein